MCMFNGPEVTLPAKGEVAYRTFNVELDEDTQQARLHGFAGMYPASPDGKFTADAVPGNTDLNESGFFGYTSPEQVRCNAVVAKVRMRGQAVRNAPYESPGLRAEFMEVEHIWIDPNFKLVEDCDSYADLCLLQDYCIDSLSMEQQKAFDKQVNALQAQVEALNEAMLVAVRKNIDAQQVAAHLRTHHGVKVTVGKMPKPRKKAAKKKVAKKAVKRKAGKK